MFLVIETEEEKFKRHKLEAALSNSQTDLKTWQKLAIEPFGLINGKFYIFNGANIVF